MLRAIAFSGGKVVPSARFRIRQLVDELARRSVHLTETYPAAGRFPPKARSVRPFWLMASLAQRLPAIFASWSYDISILQGEMISTIYTLEWLTHRPRILDLDDAIWLHRQGRAARKLARVVDHVVCANAYLAEYCSQFNRNVTIIPTSVDIERFRLAGRHTPNKLIGWSGSSSGFPYLYQIEKQLDAVLRRHPDWKLRIVSDQPPQFQGIDASRLEFIRWSADNEVATIADLDIGLAPLADDEWCRGKSSYKTLLYMSCGVPVVASDI